MVRYLKFIILIFGGLGVVVGTFFFLQNKHDITTALDYRERLSYDYLVKSCTGIENNYFMPCLTKTFDEYSSKVSLSGLSMGMKMVYSTVDQDKAFSKLLIGEDAKEMLYSINHLRINNITMSKAYKNYFGFKSMLGGYISSLKERFYPKAFEFSENIILGLQGEKGLKSISDSKIQSELFTEFEKQKIEYYQIKETVNEFLDAKILELKD